MNTLVILITFKHMFDIIIETRPIKHNNNIKHNHSYDDILRSRSGGYSIPLFCHFFMMSDTNNQNSCLQKPCQSNQSSYPNTGLEDRTPDLSERPVLYTGVLWIGVSQLKYLINSFKMNKYLSQLVQLLSLFQLDKVTCKNKACDGRNVTGLDR